MNLDAFYIFPKFWLQIHCLAWHHIQYIKKRLLTIPSGSHQCFMSEVLDNIQNIHVSLNIWCTGPHFWGKIIWLNVQGVGNIWHPMMFCHRNKFTISTCWNCHRYDRCLQKCCQYENVMTHVGKTWCCHADNSGMFIHANIILATKSLHWNPLINRHS